MALTLALFEGRQVRNSFIIECDDDATASHLCSAEGTHVLFSGNRGAVERRSDAHLLESSCASRWKHQRCLR